MGSDATPREQAWAPSGHSDARLQATLDSLEREGDAFRVLRAARAARGYTPVAVAERLEVRVLYVEALEAGRLETLPGPGYASGVLWRFCVLVDLDPAVMVEAAHIPAFFDVDCLPGSRRLAEWAGMGRRAARIRAVVWAGAVAALLVVAVTAYLFLR